MRLLFSAIAFVPALVFGQTEGTLIGGGMAFSYPNFRNLDGDLSDGIYLSVENRSAISGRFTAAPQFTYTFTEYRTRTEGVQTGATMHDFAFAVVMLADWFKDAKREGVNLALGPGMSYAYSPHLGTQPIAVVIGGVGYRVKNTELRMRCRYGLDSMLRDRNDRMVPVHGELGIAVIL